MAFANSNRVSISYIKETQFGVTPTAGNPSAVRYTGESFKNDLTTESSDEIRADRQVTDLITLQGSAAGSLDIEFSYGEYDNLIESVYESTWQVYGTNGVGGGFTATFAADSITASAALTGNSAFTNLKKGQWVSVSGSTNAGQNILVQVSKATAPTTTVLKLEGTPFTGLTGSGGPDVKLSSTFLENGTTLTSYSVERGHEDVGEFLTYKGQRVGEFSLSIPSASKITGSIGFMGAGSEITQASILPGTLIESRTDEILNGSSSVGKLSLTGANLDGVFVKEVSFGINNQLRNRDAVGYIAPVDIADGTLEATGSLTIYFNDSSIYQAFLDNDDVALAVPLIDSNGNGYVFDFPRIKFTDADVATGGLNTDVMVTAPFTAIRDPLTGRTISVSKLTNG